jgi:hypothetical protein
VPYYAFVTSARTLIVAAALAGCDARTRDGYPDVRGTYDGQLESEYTWLSDGHRLSGVACGLTLVIDREEAGALRGTFQRGRPCVPSQGALAGAIQRDGTLMLDLAGPRGFQDFDGCAYVDGPRTWSGRSTGKELTATIELVLDCEDGRLRGRRRVDVVPRPKS